jgi:hypothetical protein
MEGNKLRHSFVKKTKKSELDRMLEIMRRAPMTTISNPPSRLIKVSSQQAISNELLITNRYSIENFREKLKHDLILDLVQKIKDQNLIEYEEFYNIENNTTVMRMSLNVKGVDDVRRDNG